MKLEFYDVKTKAKVNAVVEEVKEVDGRAFAFGKSPDGRRLSRILGKDQLAKFKKGGR